ncbi:MAG: hypothetical protein RIC56_05060 [Pseudomonadales bacterium]
MKVATGLLVALVLLSGSARGADFIAVEDECNGRKLLIQGPIEPGDDDRFGDVLAAHIAGGELPAVQDPDVLWTVELDSPGGDPAAAMAIGRLLRTALATTKVAYRYARRGDGVWDFARGADLVCLDGRDRLSGCHQDLVEAECTGACLLIWLGGATRHANEGRLGVHGLGGDATAVTAYLQDMGVADSSLPGLAGGSDDATDDATGDATGDGWLDWPQRHELGGRAPLLDELIAGCPAALTREESYRSITAPSAAERDALMDRADAHRACRRQRLADARAGLVTQLAGRLRAARLHSGSRELAASGAAP